MISLVVLKERFNLEISNLDINEEYIIFKTIFDYRTFPTLYSSLEKCYISKTVIFFSFSDEGEKATIIDGMYMHKLNGCSNISLDYKIKKYSKHREQKIDRDFLINQIHLTVRLKLV